jgi:hypothetical protein
VFSFLPNPLAVQVVFKEIASVQAHHRLKGIRGACQITFMLQPFTDGNTPPELIQVKTTGAIRIKEVPITIVADEDPFFG